MSRPATGQVIVRKRKQGRTFAIRFRAYGDRHFATLGTASEGWTEKKAHEELENTLADVRRGIWKAPSPEPAPAPTVEPTFHEFSSDWFARRELEGLRPRSLEHLRWALSSHLLPYLHHRLLSEITPEVIDNYTAAKVAEGRLSNGSINTTVGVLSSVLELAVEYGHIPNNPAAGRRRKLPTSKTTREFLEPEQVAVLLDAAGDLDAADRSGRRYRRPLLATLAYAGLRIGELLALIWGDVDLAQGSIRVRESKTAAGVRQVDIQPELRDELGSWKASTGFAKTDDLVFPTATGRAHNRNNVRRRILLRAVDRANEKQVERAKAPLPERLSPHALRRSFASLLVASGEDVAYVMGQLGHSDPKLTLGLYAKALRSKRRRADEGSRQHGHPANDSEIVDRDLLHRR